MADSMNSFILLIPFIALPLMWLFVVSLISLLSGWKNLARHYAVDTPELAPKPQMKWQSFSMGYSPIFAASYSRVVNISVTETYLYLSTMWLFRVGHKPLRIPFKDIEITDTKVLFFDIKRLATKQSPNIKIYMRPRLVEKIENFAVATT